MNWKSKALIALHCAALSSSAMAACCYFAAVDKDVKQPGQRAFITWDETEKQESFTVQPQFEGSASDFGMVIPTPAKPKLQEMPRDFFKALAVFTILEPMDISKFNAPNDASQLWGQNGGRRWNKILQKLDGAGARTGSGRKSRLQNFGSRQGFRSL